MALIERINALGVRSRVKWGETNSVRKHLTYMPSKRVSEKDIIVSAAAPARRKAAPAKRVSRTAPGSPTAAAAEAPVTQPMPEAPSQEKIASLAYSYWEARGCQGGSPEADWLRAEQELLTLSANA
jgi:hypothetical protein